MADFAFTRQDDTSITSETTKIVPLTCHGHSRPITHISFSSQVSPNSSSPSTTPANTASTAASSSPSSTSVSTPQFYLISACKDNNPMLRDGLTGDWIGTFIGHKGAVWSARLSSDATLAATGSADFSARIWDTFTGEPLHTLVHNHIVRAVAFPPQPRPQLLATGGMEKKLRIWDLPRVGAATTPADGTNGTHTSTSDGIGNSVSGRDPVPTAYEIGAGDHQGAIKSIIWTRDPNILVTAADDKKLRWYDLRSRTRIAEYELAAQPGSCELNGIGSSPSDLLDTTTTTTSSSSHHPPGGTIAVAAGKNIYFFSGARPATLLKHIPTDKDVASVALNAAGTRFVTGSPHDTWVHVWDYASGRELETGRGHHGPVWSTCFSPDAKMYATGSEDGTVKLWKFTDGAYGLWR